MGRNDVILQVQIVEQLDREDFPAEASSLCFCLQEFMFIKFASGFSILQTAVGALDYMQFLSTKELM